MGETNQSRRTPKMLETTGFFLGCMSDRRPLAALRGKQNLNRNYLNMLTLFKIQKENPEKTPSKRTNGISNKTAIKTQTLIYPQESGVTGLEVGTES